MKFTDYLWQKIKPTYHEIVFHPFNQEMADGTLSEERFHFYLQQDAAYLVQFSRVLALIAGRARSSALISDFLQLSLSTLNVERELHAHYLDLNAAENCVDPTPACLSYTRYLLSTAALNSFEEALAAILPCFWIYRELGRHIAQRVEEDNPYVHWINTYTHPEFSKYTDKAIAILDEAASTASKSSLKLMEETFEHSALFEWHFWNDAYNMTTFRNICIPAII
jgi:thiaminase (transcriptional activator TenA)